MEMEANEFSTSTNISFDSSFDFTADNVRETRASLVVEILSELGIRGYKENTKKRKEETEGTHLVW